jgi:putative ABC transport system permease protein
MRTYFLTGIRNMRKRLGYTLINVLGLTLGLASCLLIFLIVRYELGYDAFNSKADRIYRVNHHSIDYNPRVSPAIAPAFRNDFPELQVAQFFYEDGLLRIGNDRYNEKNFAFADEYVPRVFDYQWVEGDPNTALTNPNSIVLTETWAKKYFGAKNAIGEIINLDNQYDCKVTGIIRDLPGNTSLPLPFLVSMSTIKKQMADMGREYYNNPDGNFTFICLPENYPIKRVRDRIHGFMEKNWGKDIAKEAVLILQPLREIHFDQRYLDISVSATTSKQTYYALAGIALFIIVTACINFINLATGQAATRAREVGVRKVLGARRLQLVGQFMAETALQVVTAVLLALLAVALLLPLLSTGLDIHIGTNELREPLVLGLLAALTVVVTLLAGLYPAFVQSAFSPVVSLKGSSAISRGNLSLRRGLVVLQFGISQVMIIGTVVVARQMDFFQNRNLGFNKDFVISFDAPDSAHRQVVWNELAGDPGITAVSFCSGSPAHISGASGYDAPQLGLTGENITELKFVDEHFIRMFGLNMLAGDTIARRLDKDSIFPVVVNETLVHSLKIQDPRLAVGKKVYVSGTPCRIIGVVQDFQSESKHKKRRACIMVYAENNFWTACVRLNPVGMHATIDRIGKRWSALNPKGLFRYEFLDDHIASFYRQEQKVYTAFRLFSCIAILIGCLGLYGLIAFATLQRTKEVGIRKTLGASIPNILFLFGREFIWLILIAFVVAAPIAWLTMNAWLNNFAYRIGIGWDTFLIAILSSVLIAAFTISWKSVKAALVSPVKTLRSE